MTDYKNLGRESGIIAYEIGDDFIRLKYEDNEVYLYNVESTGEEQIEKKWKNWQLKVVV